MKALLRTNDPVEISWLLAELSARGIDAVVLDAHTSIAEGSLGILPRRVMVSDEDFPRASRILEGARRDIGAP